LKNAGTPWTLSDEFADGPVEKGVPAGEERIEEWLMRKNLRQAARLINKKRRFIL